MAAAPKGRYRGSGRCIPCRRRVRRDRGRRWVSSVRYASAGSPRSSRCGAIQVEGTGDADRIRRHGVAMRSMLNVPRSPTTMGSRRVNSLGRTLSGRRRGSSSKRRTAGMTPGAREGRRVFTSTSHSCNWAWRSAKSTKRRCLKKLRFAQPTKFSTAHFWCAAAGQQTDLFVRHERHYDPTRVLEARAKEVHALRGPV